MATENLSKTLDKIVLEYFPKASEEDMDHILWNHTGFPGFWRGDQPIETTLRQQLAVYREICDLDMLQCDLCTGGIAWDGKKWMYMHEVCSREWDLITHERRDEVAFWLSVRDD